MSKYLAQKQTLLKICTSSYKSEIHFLMAFLYIHSTKYTINKQTCPKFPESALQQSRLYEHNIRSPPPKKTHLLNKESRIADYICTHITRIYIYKLKSTLNAYSQRYLVIQCLISFQLSNFPYGNIVDPLFPLSFPIHILRPTPALNCFQSNPLGVKAHRKRSFKF